MFSLQLITKEALRELVLEAESLVLQQINEKTSIKEYFLHEVLSPPSPCKSVPKKLMDKNQKHSSKINRVEVKKKELLKFLKLHELISTGMVTKESRSSVENS